MTTLVCQNLNVSIAGVQVVRDFDLTLSPGEFWGLLGSNGSGKTTLLRCLAGLKLPDSGAIFLNGGDIQTLPRRLVARHVSMMQQHTAYAFDSNVLQTALTGRHPHLGRWQREGPDDFAKALTALTAVDLKGFAQRSVTGLSGGEARRLAFASVLVQEAAVTLLDEPTNHLDLRHQVQIMGLIRNRSVEQKGTAFAALHDVNLAARYCTHVVMLFGDGKWCLGPSQEMLNETNLTQLYGCAVEKLTGPSGSRFFPAAGK